MNLFLFCVMFYVKNGSLSAKTAVIDGHLTYFNGVSQVYPTL